MTSSNNHEAHDSHEHQMHEGHHTHHHEGHEMHEHHGHHHGNFKRKFLYHYYLPYQSSFYHQ